MKTVIRSIVYSTFFCNICFEFIEDDSGWWDYVLPGCSCASSSRKEQRKHKSLVRLFLARTPPTSLRERKKSILVYFQKMMLYKFHQYQVVGRALLTETDKHPKIYRMKLWATNEVRAKSKFWYF